MQAGLTKGIGSRILWLNMIGYNYNDGLEECNIYELESRDHRVASLEISYQQDENDIYF